MEIDIEYQPHNDLRFCKLDQCWVREILTDGVWYCFYSSNKARLEKGNLKHTLEKMKEINFNDMVHQLSSRVTEEFKGYCHVLWEDFWPKSAGMMSGGKTAWWSIFLMWPAPHKPSTPPINYQIVS